MIDQRWESFGERLVVVGIDVIGEWRVNGLEKKRRHGEWVKDKKRDDWKRRG